MDWVKIGEVVHYYGNIDVAVVELEDYLQIGDHIGFVRHDDMLFEQEVHSMQINYQNIKTAAVGESIGLQTEQKVRAGTGVYRFA